MEPRNLAIEVQSLREVVLSVVCLIILNGNNLNYRWCKEAGGSFDF